MIWDLLPSQFSCWVNTLSCWANKVSCWVAVSVPLCIFFTWLQYARFTYAYVRRYLCINFYVQNFQNLLTMNFAVVVHHEVLNYFAPNFSSTTTGPNWATLTTYLVKIKVPPSYPLHNSQIRPVSLDCWLGGSVSWWILGVRQSYGPPNTCHNIYY